MYHIENRGMGGFLNPPGDAEHTYSIADGSGPDHGSMSLRYALTRPYVPESMKAKIRALIEAHPPQYTDEWEQKCYTYFAHCYSPDGSEGNVGKCVVMKDGSIPERHLAYLHVRSFFPDAKPRLDLIK